MRSVLLLSLILAGSPAGQTQAPATQKPPAPATQKPPAPDTQKPPAPDTQKPPTSTAKPQPAQPVRRATPPAARGGMAITVTDPSGATLPGITVQVLGASDRSGETNPSGQINFTGMQAATYRLRLTGDEVTAFEREVTLRANQVADVDITLNPAPPPRVITIAAEPPPPVETSAVLGPLGQPQTLSIVDLLEQEFVGRQPRRESLLSCSGGLRTTMIQLNDPQPERLYESSEAAYYVLGGEGTLVLNGRETKLQTNGFVSVPRGTTHSFVRRGNRPFVLLATLGGDPCEEPK